MYKILIWKDHYTNMENTYVAKQNSNGTITLTPAGTVIQQGTSMSAENFNNMECGILDADLANRLLLLLSRNNAEELAKLKAIISAGGGGGGLGARISEVTLRGDGWYGDKSPYYQVVQIDGITNNSQVDLTPSVEQLSVFYEKSLAFVAENDGGMVTVYAIGQKPENDYTIQVTITEVAV